MFSCRGEPDVARLGVLDQVEAVPEWVREGDEPPQAWMVHLALERRAGVHRPLNGSVEVIDHEVQMDRSPVAPEVLAQHVLTGRELRLGTREQMDRHLGAGEFRPARCETARDR